ncbi:hypothetical protein DSECCO2_475910 [anaerobic digester metagenome]
MIVDIVVFFTCHFAKLVTAQFRIFPQSGIEQGVAWSFAILLIIPQHDGDFSAFISAGIQFQRCFVARALLIFPVQEQAMEAAFSAFLPPRKGGRSFQHHIQIPIYQAGIYVP